MAGKKRRILLADTALFTVLFIAVRLVLHLFRLNYRKWFPVLCLFLIMVGIIAGIIQLLLKILICGEVKRIEEDYGKGGFDPIGNPYGYDYSVVSATYYDEDGNIVSQESTD